MKTVLLMWDFDVESKQQSGQPVGFLIYAPEMETHINCFKIH